MTDLSGKDYFGVKEAAAYCCVSESQFLRKITDTGLIPGKLWGKKVFRKTDLQRLIEDTAWPQFSGATTGVNQGRSRRPPSSHGGEILKGVKHLTRYCAN